MYEHFQEWDKTMYEHFEEWYKTMYEHSEEWYINNVWTFRRMVHKQCMDISKNGT